MKKELIQLRDAMKAKGVHIYLIPTGDFHGSEYLHDFFKTRAFVSGFSGSAGTLIVTMEEARLWTDGRYFLQAAMELEGTGIQLMKDKEPGVPTIKEYLSDIFAEGTIMAFDGRVVPCSAGREYAKLAAEKGGMVNPNLDLVGEIWADRPALKGKAIWEYPITSAGLPYETKIAQVRDLMAKAGADYHLITTLDDNAWLYNLRGSDVERTPVFFSYTLITPEETVLYLFRDSIEDNLLPQGVTTKDYFAAENHLTIMEDLAEIPSGKTILVNPDTASFSIIAAIPEDVDLLETECCPSTRLKACKNPVEIQATKEAHINDGVAMVNFFHWLKKEVKSRQVGEFTIGAPIEDPMTEIGASDYLEEQRKRLPGFINLSFDTIAGYMEHGAIVHYGASPESNAYLYPEGLFLVDSGGQYLTGTTDITRTIALGPLTQRMKECYTVVLKGHLDLAMAKFDDTTTGKDLHEITIAPLDAYGISYNHGTGHGVGHTLCVHEGPNRINSVSEEHIIPGMITSDEPGYYPEGEFGVRIENEILCVPVASRETLSPTEAEKKEGIKYAFEMLTCCPYERDAILPEMLTEEEREYLNSYHQWVYEKLNPLLDSEVSAWLQGVCQPL